MLLIFVFILLGIGIGILVSVYSIFFPLIVNLGEIGNFNVAYYGAISSLERAQLALKNKLPGFEGSGWYISWSNRWPKSDYKTGAFGFINSKNTNGISWTISSRTQSIPKAWEGNIEYLLAANDSNNYNTLDYKNNEKILLSYDNTTNTNEYYTWTTNMTYYNWGRLTGTIRLAPKIYSWFSNQWLCTTCDENGDEIQNDSVVDRSLEGTKDWTYFKILPNIWIFFYSGLQINWQKDIAIRKSTINNTGKLDFTSDFNPIDDTEHINNSSSHVVISSNPGNVESFPFNTILTSNYTWLELNLWLTYPLTTANNNIYPFLEYQLHWTCVSGPCFADRFYTLQWTSRVGDYDVQIVVKKPTSQWSVVGSFTVIF